jgi:uncharacterized protein (TIGR02217 family)
MSLYTIDCTPSTYNHTNSAATEETVLSFSVAIPSGSWSGLELTFRSNWTLPAGCNPITMTWYHSAVGGTALDHITESLTTGTLSSRMRVARSAIAGLSLNAGGTFTFAFGLLEASSGNHHPAVSGDELSITLYGIRAGDTPFDEIQFPTNISYGAVGGVTFSTTVLTTGDGFEQRLGLWSNGRGKWNVSHVQKSASDMQTLAAFFRARRGKYRGFRFKDWTDYTVTGHDNVLIKLGEHNLQLVKLYTSGSRTSTRIITKPVSGQVTLYSGSSAINPTTWAVDTATGIISIDTAISSTVYNWQGQFDVPIRFDTDQMQAKSVFLTNLEWNNIPLIEIAVG